MLDDTNDKAKYDVAIAKKMRELPTTKYLQTLSSTTADSVGASKASGDTVKVRGLNIRVADKAFSVHEERKQQDKCCL